MRPWSLRDCRRWLNKPDRLRASMWRQDEVFWRTVDKALEETRLQLDSYATTRALLDALISRLGPRWTPGPRVAPKGTSEVDGSTCTGNLTHGGDSQSGEVEDGHSGAGQPRPEKDGYRAEPQDGKPVEEQSSTTESTSTSGGRNGEQEPHEGEATPGSGAPVSYTHLTLPTIYSV